ncbi:Planctomycete cytochrome C [Stieleria neptunia]|uniref:Planctomycete cytochrome C n=1 Tax=Stieleria neptunia TaxID=2527979 RepID=A0A518HVR2_9BACT|nr:DUF1553 domain-containing protein [Stieleria neptunia]QDV44854.1 Planctomycete cytochrome C [Stieleria neptunia]
MVQFNMVRSFVVLVCGLVVCTVPSWHCLAEDLDFNRDVRPILSDKCYFCHGPDEGHREAGLRLDVREEAIDLIESGEVIDRIDSDDADLQMPPPASNLSLTEKEKRTLKRWIDEGAVYADHWAFTPLPETEAVPSPHEVEWCRETLDRFVLSRLQREELLPNPPAAPRRWLRRVTLDLTGLPPTPAEMQAFDQALAADDHRGHQDEVYQAVVDRLLQSSGFGEHLAVSWLDAARYADSYGYQSDKLNTQWPYRDWVVEALNQNLPYDQFLTWQLAGDLLPDATRQQKLATAFNRIHRLNNEGGAVFEEWRIENVADRVHTFGTAVLGLTLECCRCHDHKYDPIPMRDYYSLSAFFNSIDESGVYDRTEKVPCPSLLLPTAEQEATLQAARDQLRIAEQQYAATLKRSEQRFASWKPESDDQPTIADLRLAIGFDVDFDNTIKDVYHPSQSDRSWTSMSPLQDVVDCSIPRLDPRIASDGKDVGADQAADSLDNTGGDQSNAGPARIDVPRRAIALDGERGVTTHGVPSFDRWTAFSVVVTLRDVQRTPYRSVIAHHTRGTDCGYNGWDLTIENGHLESRMARVWPGNAMAVRTIAPIPADSWHQVTATYDGSSRAAGLRLYLDGELLETEILRDRVKKQANVVVDHGGEFVVGQRFRDRGFAGGLIDDVRVYDRALTAPELKHLATGAPIRPTKDYFASAIDPPSREAMQVLTAARKAVVMAEEAMNEIPIMEEMQHARPAYVLARGQYDAPKNEDTRVDRDTFSQFGLPFPDDAPRDRLGLARWVTDPRNPLTGRVAVNRLWGSFFASPLVATPENFGLQGELPTHPELLDWMARDFVDHGWDVKRLCRQIVLSSTYRQDSRVSAEKLQRDPDNVLLARGPSNRLSAEQIRDLALAASGLMDKQQGGPPVSPYQPGADLWRESNGMSPPYQQSVGTALYRRSLYSVWKRTAPLPNMLALDATTREVCTMERSRTNTPLQALVLMNDVQFVEAARALAESVMGESDDMARIQLAFAKLTGRRADENEVTHLVSLLEQEQTYFGEHPQRAAELVAIGQSPSSQDAPVPHLAAMTIVCQAIMNLDATVWKR